MNANPTGRNAKGAIATLEEDIHSPPPENNLAQTVADVFSAAARRGAGRTDPFEAAVRAYMSRNPDVPYDEAARAVADIICNDTRNVGHGHDEGEL